jgi:hypothetical protein
VEKKQVNYTDALQCPRSARLFFLHFYIFKEAQGLSGLCRDVIRVQERVLKNV